MGGTRSTTSGGRIATSRLHRSGTDAQRVLVVGDGSFVNEPDDPEQLRFTDLLADRIAARTRRALDLDVVWDLAPVLHAVTSSTGAWRLWRYEAVVVLVREPTADGGGATPGGSRPEADPAGGPGARGGQPRARGAPPGRRGAATRGRRTPSRGAARIRAVVSSIAVQLGSDGLLARGPTRADAIAECVCDLLEETSERGAAAPAAPRASCGRARNRRPSGSAPSIGRSSSSAGSRRTWNAWSCSPATRSTCRSRR